MIDVQDFRRMQPGAKLEFLYSEIARLEALIPKKSRRGGKQWEKKSQSQTSSDLTQPTSLSSRRPSSTLSTASEAEVDSSTGMTRTRRKGSE